MTRVLFAIAGLTAVYALALASAAPWDLGIGAVIATLVIAVFRPFMFPGAAIGGGETMRRAIRFPRLALATAAEIIRGTVTIARVVLSRDPSRESGFVIVPIGERTEHGLAVSAMANTLSPGTVLVDVDPAAATWTIHAIDISDPDAVREEIAEFYDRYQRPVWP